MPTYQYSCLHTEDPITRSMEVQTVTVREGPPTQAPLCSCGAVMKRDYRGESVSTFREAPKANTHDILPTAKDFERPEDPTGEQGMRNWMETHEPRPGNKNPRWPTLSERTGV